MISADYAIGLQVSGRPEGCRPVALPGSRKHLQELVKWKWEPGA